MKKWKNAFTPLRPLDVAAEYATARLTGRYLIVAQQALSLFERGLVRESKNLLDEVTRDEFESGSDYLRWAQFKALFSKSSIKGDARKRRDAALIKFNKAEDACKRANRRLAWYGARTDRENPIYRVILSRARGVISQVLGNFTEATLEHILDASRPGSGTAIGTKEPDKVTLPFKLGRQTDLACSTNAKPYARMLVELSPAWSRIRADIDWNSLTFVVQYEEVNFNRLAFVPKDAETDRTIAVEPHLNQCLQLGVGEYIARRLKSFGIDLHDQSVNQRLARNAASWWFLQDPDVTLDLKQASDSLPIALVRRLVPTVWCEFLDALRSSHYVIPGDKVPKEYHKWSSMGNGYTFPLETLIFYALGRACSSLMCNPSRVSVYGDDIVCRRSVAALLIEVLGYCGFRINTDKSCFFGPFRESCGEDWWGNERVVPIYLKWMENLRLTDIYRCVNHFGPLLHSEDLLRRLFKAHRGYEVLYGLRNDDSASCVFGDFSFLRERGHLRYDKQLQAWKYRAATFMPLKRHVGETLGMTAALKGEVNLTDVLAVTRKGWRQASNKAHWARSTLRARGKWTTCWRVGD